MMKRLVDNASEKNKIMFVRMVASWSEPKYKGNVIKHTFVYILMDRYPGNLAEQLNNKPGVFGRHMSEPMESLEFFISCYLLREIIESVHYLHSVCNTQRPQTTEYSVQQWK